MKKTLRILCNLVCMLALVALVLSGCDLRDFETIPPGITAEDDSPAATTPSETKPSETTTPEITTPEETAPAPTDKHTHIWSEWIIVKEAKCEVKGLLQRHCAECYYTESKPIDVLGHTKVVDKAVAPTCTRIGFTEGSHCFACGKVLVAQQIIDALGHIEVIDEAVAPTCTTDGLTKGKHCPVCGCVLVRQQTISATGHTWDEGKVTTAPTCTTSGTKTFTCKCNETLEKTISALGHDCANGACSRCGKYFCEIHDFVNGACSRCGCCETHSYMVDYVNNPARFNNTWGICTVCGYIDEYHEHSIQNGKCVYCDYEFKQFEVPSTFDNDGDGTVEVFYFSHALPEEFTGEGVIWLDAYNSSTGDYMINDEIGFGSGSLPYPHVYCYDAKATDSIVLTFNVEKAGLYNVAVHYRIKDQKVRGAKFVVNGGEGINHTYGWATADDAYECRNNDFLIGAYMTGLQFELKEGENVITILVANGVAKSEQFRDLYLVPAEVPECETHDYGNRFDKKWGICVVCGYVDDNHEHSIRDGKCEYCDYTFQPFEDASRLLN